VAKKMVGWQRRGMSGKEAGWVTKKRDGWLRRGMGG
jgi:hypothetical protein